MSTRTTYEVGVGEQVTVRLDETPTTGYQWEVVDVPSGLAVETSSFEPPPPSAAPGAGGQRVVTLTAVEPGHHRLRLQRRRAWEPPAAETLEIVVHVS
jgi:inhibitor of cysteine peptidase